MAHHNQITSHDHKPQPLTIGPFLNLQYHNIMYIYLWLASFHCVLSFYGRDITDMTQEYICCSYTVFLIHVHVHLYICKFTKCIHWKVAVVSFVSCMIIKSHLKSHYELVRRIWELFPKYTCGGNFYHVPSNLCSEVERYLPLLT